VPKVILELKVQQALKVFREKPDLLVLPVLQVLKDPRVLRVTRVM
jgi:hypothetical protein